MAGKTSDKVAVKTDPKLWDKCVKTALAKFDGKYSARMYQHATHLYKSQGGGYKGRKSKHNSMRVWTNERWRTKSGKPSSETGERYLPEHVLRKLSADEYAASTRKKRTDTRHGLQYSVEPKRVRSKINRLIKSKRR
ncbi:hypothetical protein F-E9_284 [Faustovirus]|nr:hypothetical protein F-E9_284 [Faustovirus]